MRYLEHPVPASLDGVVETVWTLESEAGEAAPATPEPVIPDGRAEIVVHFGAPFERWDDGRSARQPDILVAGQIDAPLLLRPTGPAGVLGIRLRPGGAPALLPAPQHELAGLTERARDVSPALEAWLEQARDAGRTPAGAAAIVCDGLARLSRRDALDRRAVHAAELVDLAPAAHSVDAIAAAVGLTRRQLERLFRQHVGLSPGTLRRIRRFQRALRLLDARAGAGSRRPGTDSALAGGYADQAHFVREFRALAGTTPTQHLLARASLTGVFVPARPASALP